MGLCAAEFGCLQGWRPQSLPRHHLQGLINLMELKIVLQHLISGSVLALHVLCPINSTHPGKVSLVSCLSAHQVLGDSNKVTPLPSFCKTESRQLSSSWHTCAPRYCAGSLLGLLQVFFLVSRSPQLDTARQHPSCRVEGSNYVCPCDTEAPFVAKCMKLW